MRNGDWDDKYSVVGDNPEVGFLDFEMEMSSQDFRAIDEGPVVVSNPFPFVGRNKPQSIPVGETAAASITIQNTSDEPIDLWSVTIYNSNPLESFTLSLLEPPSATTDIDRIREFLESTTLEDRVLQPRSTLTIWLSCKPKEACLHTAIVQFNVGDDKIERIAYLLAEDQVALLLAPNKPYSRAPRRRQFGTVNNQYVPGPRLTRGGKHASSYFLPQYPIPERVRELLGKKQIPDVVLQGLSIENYAHFFSNLIIMEEIHLEEEMRAHDLEMVTMRRVYNFLALEVPGLAEKRPSLVRGDHIFVKTVSDGADAMEYEGSIYRVEADEVFLRFHIKFHNNHHEGKLYNVRFTYGRTNMRRQYQAVEMAMCLDLELLFPSECSLERRLMKASRIELFNKNFNEEQVSSVEMILGCKGAPPYVIHGPPGTGKTMTMVEAILQLYTMRKKSQILVCAASNSAADHVLQKLTAEELGVVQGHEIFRLNATSRPYEDVPVELTHFCYADGSVFRCPPLKALLHYRIIICTYMSASLLYAEGIRKGHFSHIFLDEAGQASEPETMIPLANLCTRQTLVVLAGDPLQLGPVVYSEDADSCGLGKSFLQRLFECPMYSGDDKNFVTKLVRNYRCHQAILELPSRLFYEGELIACKEANTPLSNWEGLPNEGFPVLFVGIQGCDEREGNNPSWFNRFEASKVVDIIKKLMASTNVNGGDIGVITPYRQQVLKLKTALESLGVDNVKVGSVEQFQGQEREVIIISTVRSTVKHNDFDKIFNLGFLSNPKRFNVAITRAKSLLIIVGNPHIICQDPHWDELLRRCCDNDSYQGCAPPPRPVDHYNAEGADLENDCTGNESLEFEEIHKPNFNEAEWSDGWT